MIDFRLALTAAAALALAACADNSPAADGAEQADPGPATAPADTPAAGMADNATSSAVEASGPIPAALHGRWGLTPADCEPQSGRATGLLVISGDELRFYESVAEPASDIESDADSISGNWTFESEGMTEQRFQTLQLRDGKLVRSENGPANSFTYVRCDGA